MLVTNISSDTEFFVVYSSSLAGVGKSAGLYFSSEAYSLLFTGLGMTGRSAVRVGCIVTVKAGLLL